MLKATGSHHHLGAGWLRLYASPFMVSP